MRSSTDGRRATVVLPGAHETARIRELVEQGVERGDYDSYEADLRERGQANPLGRIGDPMELGDTVTFLSSPRSGYSNGESTLVDGGQSRSNL